jgi:flagellar hook-associated protein 3 FlgL
MTIRTLSTAGFNQAMMNNVGSLTSELQRVQTQISTGLKTRQYGDLGSSAVRDLNLRNQTAGIDAYQRTITVVQGRLDIVDKNLLSMRTDALQVRDLIIAQGNHDAGREAIVAAAKNALTNIVSKLNTNVNGRFVFGGVETQSAPMVSADALLATASGAVNAALSAAPPGVPAAIQGAVDDVFNGVNPPATPADANWYAGGAAHPSTEIDHGLPLDYSITGNDPAFAKMLNALATIASLPTPADGPAAAPPATIDRADFDAAMQAAFNTLNGGLGGLDMLVSKNGNNQSLLDSTGQMHEATQTIVKSQIGDIENVDLTEASTRLSQLQTQLQATFQTIALLRSLSLVDYLK